MNGWKALRLVPPAGSFSGADQTLDLHDLDLKEQCMEGRKSRASTWWENRTCSEWFDHFLPRRSRTQDPGPGLRNPPPLSLLNHDAEILLPSFKPIFSPSYEAGGSFPDSCLDFEEDGHWLHATMMEGISDGAGESTADEIDTASSYHRATLVPVQGNVAPRQQLVASP